MARSSPSSLDDGKDLEKNSSSPTSDEDYTPGAEPDADLHLRESQHEARHSISESDDDDDEASTTRRNGDGASLASRVISRITTRSSVAPSPPPDGGLAAWLVAKTTQLTSSRGVTNSFGVFQTYYATTLGRPPSDISWIGSFQIFLLFFVGTFTGRLTDAGFLRPCLITGITLIAIGSFTAAQCTQYWQLFIAQGVCLGLGNGFLFCPAVAVTSTYWQRKRALILGIQASGSATGGLIFPSMVRQLLPSVGFSWTMRSIGFIQIGCLLVAFFCLKTRVPPRRTGSLIDFASFKELDYTCYAIGTFLCFWGMYVPFFFLASYSRDIQGMSYSASLNMIMVLNGIGLVGRLIPSFFADKLGAVNMYIPMAVCGAVLMYAWAGVSNIPGLYVWACFFGIAVGGISSLFPAALSSLTLDPRKQGTRMGMVFTIVSFAVLTGPPLAGALIARMNGSFLGAQLFAGTSLALGSVSVCVAREVRRRKGGLKLVSKV